MAQRQKNITTLKPIKNKILDLETKRHFNYLSITTKTAKDKIYNCWWCTLPIENDPIGCPLSIAHESQGYKEPLTIIRKKSKEEITASSSKITYYTDGLFCCLNCIKAYIMESGEHDAKYKDSIRLLAMMACDNEQSQDPLTVNPSPPWRFLQQYGGHLTVDQYKEMIGRMIYKEKGIIQIQPITTLYEEDEKF
ncbi:MAG: hypothetical protein ACRCZ0_07675 [Cetobacterium sp.]